MHALDERKPHLHDSHIAALMAAYDYLLAFPNVVPAFKAISEDSSFVSVLFFQ
jgi:hypothetical protein